MEQEYLGVHTEPEHLRLSVSEIESMEVDGYYTHINMSNGTYNLVTKKK